MPILKKEEFDKLARFDNNPCVSIYIPTDRAGKDVLNEKDRIHLKSQWKKAYEKLKDLGYDQDKIARIGTPVEDLLEDQDFWRHQSDGLALFLDGFSEKFSVPVTFEAGTYVSDYFYLKPLIPMFSGDGRFYLLVLQMDRVQLYEASKYSITKVEIADLTPDRLEDRVGYDYEEKNLQHQTQQKQTGSTTFQGHAGADRDHKNEILRFFRSVDKGIHHILQNQHVPLLVACQDYLFPIYHEASTYKDLYPKALPGNPQDFENTPALHTAACDFLRPYFEKEKQEKMEQFQELNPSRTSTRVSEIIPAIYEGKVDTLFLQNRTDIWGNYNEKMASVQVDDHESSANISLMNLAAVKVIEQGGQVYLVEDQFMPDKNSEMNAVFRYN